MTTELMSTREVADYLRIKERKVYDLVRERKIPCSRVTGKWLFPATSSTGGSPRTPNSPKPARPAPRRRWWPAAMTRSWTGRCANPIAAWP